MVHHVGTDGCVESWDCENVGMAIHRDTQYVILRDTIAPLVDCPYLFDVE